MIISHKHRFIFFAVPKTATHAIRTALRSCLDPNDWEQQILFGRQSLPIPAIARLQHGHVSARQLQPHVSTDIWESYFKFGFVRNPFDRFVSICFFLMRNDPDFAASPVSSMKRLISKDSFQRRILVRPQSELLVDESGQTVMDVVGRYENLQQSFDTICDAIDIPRTDLTTRNPSQHKSFVEYFDDELTETIGRFYAQDFKDYCYDRELI